ncbi:acetyl-CoA carboxylase, biotin carboxyl carrier protein [Salipaludibacillus neizhouensis]|uniref:Biotin carboxyl carrier protein of acetyl-CoA carboxylase n=1 Tax=Salipaludibacillus neizhouensis TaxID=885475 RepID=A0A3A9KDE4_9BACI|nr:acetyl-CoA carboxylase biotin carboxyl carrier protein [Salipaludibacillus neizhouensis]RKL68770.1 acetyl-CoA carboxylase, biotin carboxyl carrier protein [Salipaludibacillus neizhouensis]
MLKIQEIRELIKLIDESSINEFKFEQNGSKVTMRKNIYGKMQSSQVNDEANSRVISQESSEVQSERPPATDSDSEQQSLVMGNEEEKSVNTNAGLHTITSPMVGTFYEAASPDSPVYVKSGDQVNNESVVCIIEAMKLMNEIEAEIKGEIVEVLVENGQLVEYGQELFLVKPE